MGFHFLVPVFSLPATTVQVEYEILLSGTTKPFQHFGGGCVVPINGILRIDCEVQAEDLSQRT